jgi:hypothetical protein
LPVDVPAYEFLIPASPGCRPSLRDHHDDRPRSRPSEEFRRTPREHCTSDFEQSCLNLDLAIRAYCTVIVFRASVKQPHPRPFLVASVSLRWILQLAEATRRNSPDLSTVDLTVHPVHAQGTQGVGKLATVRTTTACKVSGLMSNRMIAVRC